jgi:hypothetical protein
MKSECISAAKRCPIKKRNRVLDKDRELVDILVGSAYSILSDYKLGIHKNTGDVLIRPHEARFLLGNKIRPTKSIIQLILRAMKCRGMAERNNQFIVLKSK